MAVMLWLVLAWAQGGQASVPAPAQVDAGRKLYVAQKCSVCHQVAGEGNKRFPLDGVGRRLSDEELRRWFTHTAEMESRLPKQPAIRMSSRAYRFSETQLDALVAYLRSLK